MTGSDIRYTVVVPCYNEAANLTLILNKFAVPAEAGNLSVVLVDNGSTDETASILQTELSKYPFASSIRVPVNQGYGFGILTGLKHCTSEYIGWTHADMQTDPCDILKAIALIEQNGHAKDLYIKGQRRGRAMLDSFFTGSMAIFESIYMGAELWDINGQPNLFHRSFFESWKDAPHDFALDLFAYYSARRQKLKVLRFDVQFPPRIHGSSKWNTGMQSRIKFIKRTLEFSVKLKQSIGKN